MTSPGFCFVTASGPALGVHSVAWACAVLFGAHARDLAELVQFLDPATDAERGQGLHPAARHPQERLAGCVAEADANDPQVGVDASRKGFGQTG